MNGFLFDENLPRRLTFTPGGPITHATDLGSTRSDSQIWEHARIHQLVIVSKDADFSNRIMITTPPPWVVHLRIGNLRLNAFHELLARVWPAVEQLLQTEKLICVYHDRIESFRGSNE